MTSLHRAWLARLLPRPRRAEVLADLDERFDAKRQTDGDRQAARWQRQQCRDLALWAIGERARTAGAAWAGVLGRGVVTDVRVALRSLWRSPSYACVAICTLAIGVGGNVAMFSVADDLLWRPIPFEDPHELIAIRETRNGQSWWSAAPDNVVEWRARSRTLRDVAWAQSQVMSLAGDMDPELIEALAVSPNLLRLLRVELVLGRHFEDGEDRAGAEPTVLLTEPLWRTRFGSDPAVLGRRLVLDGIGRTVVGVVPAGREPAFLGRHDLLIVRTQPPPGGMPGRGRVLRTVARLATGTTLPAAQAEMERIAADVDAAATGDLQGWSVVLRPLADEVVGPVRPVIWTLAVAMAFVLLVACANLSSLLLARGTSRATALATQASLGATRARLIRQLVVEAGVIAGLGGSVGVAVALWATRAILAIDPRSLPTPVDPSLDWRVAALAVGLIAATALLVGVLPAVRATRPRLSRVIGSRGDVSDRGGARLRSILVAAEVALVVVLLAGAGAMIRSVAALSRVETGFDPASRVAMRVTLPVLRYPDAAAMGRFTSAWLERVRALPGVASAGTITTLPLTGPGYTTYHLVRSLPPPPSGSEPIGGIEVVSPGYFETMGIAVQRGRAASAADANGESVVIVDQAMADRYWPDGSPLDDAVNYAPPTVEGGPLWRPVVGVVGAVRYGLDAEPRPRLYVPEGAGAPSFPRHRTLVARAEPGMAETVLRSLRTALADVDPLLPVGDLRMLSDVASESIRAERLQTALLTLFAVFGLTLGAVGVYGVVGYAVARRTRELGVRLALGATGPRLVGEVVRSAMRPVTAGLVIGLPLAALAGRALSSTTYGVPSFDPLTLAATTPVLALVAFVAALIPGIRAGRVDPVVALRDT